MKHMVKVVCIVAVLSGCIDAPEPRVLQGLMVNNLDDEAVRLDIYTLRMNNGPTVDLTGGAQEVNVVCYPRLENMLRVISTNLSRTETTWSHEASGWCGKVGVAMELSWDANGYRVCWGWGKMMLPGSGDIRHREWFTCDLRSGRGFT